MSLQESRRVLDIDLNVPANPDEGTPSHLPWSEATTVARHGALDLDLNMPAIQSPEAMEVTRHGLPLQMVPINVLGSSYGEASSSHHQQLINYESYVNLRESNVGSEEQGAPPYDFLPRVEAMPVARQGFVLQMVPIDVDLSDDDIIVSSPRSFAEAKNNVRRNRGGITVDVDAEDNAGESEEEAAEPPPKHATIDCPICLEPLVEETSTKCGHIFCAACLKTALAARKRCPTCRKKLTKRSYFRVFLSHNK